MIKDCIVVLAVSCVIVFMLIVAQDHPKLRRECEAKGGVLLSRENVCVKKL